MYDPWRPKHLRWDLWLTARGGPEASARKQAERVEAIVAFARAHSPYYRELYRDVPPDAPLEALPPVQKTDLMNHFDDWVTDPRVKQRDLEAFIADPALIGQSFLEHYTVAQTSGSIGVRGIILQDRSARKVYGAIGAVRGWPGLGKVLVDDFRYLQRGFRSAAIVATGGHFGSVSAFERIRFRYAWLAGRMRVFPIQDPIPELVRQLDDYRPTHIITYPSMAFVLAREQQAGRLNLRPIDFFVGGETLEVNVRAVIEKAFGCRVHDILSAVEFPNMAHCCSGNWLHLNTDWAVLEPVDRDYMPVTVGQTSHTALLTNLANRVQPFIRYEMGDSITVQPDPCPCGSPFPAIRVMGRSSESLAFQRPDGETILLTPLVFQFRIKADKRISRFQILQIAPDCLRLRLDIEPACVQEEAGVWETALGVLNEILVQHGLSHVQVERATEAPQTNPVTGKYVEIWRAPVTSL